MAKNFTLKFDLLLACLFPFALFLITLKLTWLRYPNRKNILSYFSLKSLWWNADRPFSLENAFQSYRDYPKTSSIETKNRWTAYNSLGRAHRRLGNTIGYSNKLERLKNATNMNAKITQKIAKLAATEFNLEDSHSGYGDLGRVREALKHFVRDWGKEGIREREMIFSPILNVLKEVEPSHRKNLRVLVPGCGLGRLAWEISQLGYDTTANELSFFMNLAFRFLLSEQTTTSINEHTIYPYAHWFSHQLSNDSLFRPVSFPDVVPRLTQNFRLAETDFLNLEPPQLGAPSDESPAKFIWNKPDSVEQKSRQSGYDYIVTLFFIDTSLNVLATMDHIYRLLRPGGTWINLGPLLWTSGGHSKLELSLEEVIHAAREIGFVIQDGDAAAGDVNARRTVECEYTGDANAMMRWTYKAEFWVATKAK